MKLFIYLLVLIFSLFSSPPSKEVSTSLHIACLELSYHYGTYTYPSFYATDIPAEIELSFYNGMTEYKFQGRSDQAIRAVLPAGMYELRSYYWQEQVSKTYRIEIKENQSLMISGWISEECLVPVRQEPQIQA